jgi:hypothetical protein
MVSTRQWFLHVADRRFDMKGLAALASIVCSVGVLAQAPVRSYAIPGHGTLQLTIASGWTEHVRSSDRGLPPTLEFTDEQSGSKLLVTPLWSPTDDPQFTSAEYIRVAVERSAKHVQPTAVESELVLRDIGTSSGNGYYFWATDRAPKKGEHRFMATGVVPAGKLLLSFTVLSHQQPPDGVDEALKVVKSALHQRSPAG